MQNLGESNRTRWAVQVALITGLALLFLAALLWGLQGVTPARADPGTLYVDGATGSDDSDCSSAADPCETIGYALGEADGGDEILVAEGTYTETLDISYDNLTLKGGYEAVGWTRDIAAHTTIIDADGADAAVVRIASVTGVTVEGFAIQGANHVSDNGGGFMIIGATATISGTVVKDNVAGGGGGGVWVEEGGGAPELSLINSALLNNEADGGGGLSGSGLMTLDNVRVASNLSHGGGGGVQAEAVVTITNSSVVSNTAAEWGGGISAKVAYIYNTDISGNEANGVGVIDGGGVSMGWGEPLGRLVIRDSVVSNNRAMGTEESIGGGINAQYSRATIADTVVAGNSAQYHGGVSLYHTVLTMTNSVVVSNTDVGVSGDAVTGTIMHLTAASNEDDGVAVGGAVEIVNSVLWGNGDDDFSCRGDGCKLAYSDVGTGDATGTGNISADPLFVDAANGDYHLQMGSPCIDAGTSAGAPLYDIEGTPRDAAPDMGAYEWTGSRVYLPLAARNYTAPDDVLKLGILGPFSGPSSVTGDEFKGAVNMAFDAINWRIGEYEIEPVWIDSESDPGQASQHYEDAILQDGVQAGLLNWHSSVAVSCMEVVADHQVPHFAAMGATEVVNETFNSDRDRYGYWTTKWWPTPAALNVAYVQALEHAISSGAWSPSAKTVVITGEDTEWGRGFGDAIKGNFQDAGWTVVAEEYFTPGQTDFSAVLPIIKALDPAVVAGSSYVSESVYALINQADAAGLESVMIVDALGWFGDWYGATGDSSNYVLDQQIAWATDEGEAFRQAYKDRYGTEPNPSSGGLAYDAANFFIQVAEKVYQENGELSSAAIYKFVQEEIWTGQWSYTDGIMMEEYKYTEETIPDPVVGQGYYMFPVVQYFDGEGMIVFPPDWADQPFMPPP